MIVRATYKAKLQINGLSLSHALLRPLQGIKGVRFKRVIMDESATDRSPNPPVEDKFKRLVLCSGKVRFAL